MGRNQVEEKASPLSAWKSYYINNMDHMRIPGTEPSSVILSQSG